jgi:hypothetical protein
MTYGDRAETERSPEHRVKPEAPDQRSEGSAEFGVRGGRMTYGLLAQVACRARLNRCPSCEDPSEGMREMRGGPQATSARTS